MKEDLYQTLGVEKGASPEDIKKAFRKKAIQCHPDKHPGDKSKEEEFKKINDAYMVLSDVDKRKRYDMFGEVDDMPGSMPPGHMEDILKSVFGMDIGGGMPGNGGGFSFVFMGDDGPPMGMPGGGVFEQFFGGGGHPGGGQPRRPIDVIEVPIDICDIYYGKTKKVDFELLDQCSKCNGTGASDPSGVINCMTCNGAGTVTQQMGPFFSHTVRCPNCGGQGNSIRSGKVCGCCKGQRTVYTKRAFELKIPKGIPNMFEIRMDEKGSYDERIRKNKDIVFRFRYNIPQMYALEPVQEQNEIYHHVHYQMSLTIEDVLAGFEKKVKIYNEDITIRCDHYFNPMTPFVIEGMGLPSMNRPNKQGNLIIDFRVEYTNNEKLKKHNDVFRKILKRPAVLPEVSETNKEKTFMIN